jgi:hypothetical protein
LSDIHIVVDDLNNKYSHEFLYDIYEHCNMYKICGLYCKICKYKLYIYLATNGYLFDEQLNFTYVININGLEYAFDSILSCEEYIIKNIIE